MYVQVEVKNRAIQPVGKPGPLGQRPGAEEKEGEAQGTVSDVVGVDAAAHARFQHAGKVNLPIGSKTFKFRLSVGILTVLMVVFRIS